jgi:hypothetical protein
MNFKEPDHGVGDVVYILNGNDSIVETTIKAIIISKNGPPLYVVDYDPNMRFATVYRRLDYARNSAIEALTEG